MEQGLCFVFDVAEAGWASRLRSTLGDRFKVRQVELRAGGRLFRRCDEVEGRPQEGDAPAVAVVATPSCEWPGLEDLVTALRRRRPGLPLVVARPPGGDDAEAAIRLLEAGVVDLADLPPHAGDLLPRLWRLGLGACEPAGDGEVAAATVALKERVGLRHLVGDSPAFLEVVGRIPPLARCDATVLITGDTGTGKEVCARAIHHLSSRAANPFVAVDCGALPENLVENELFGHRRSAFTGATTDSDGLVAGAEGGTLLLDEVDSLSPPAQVKLLRFLQDKEYRPLGSTRPVRADVRLIAATNARLERLVEEGSFRRDLYYRLHVLPLKLPPLRHRRGDIPRLARYFLSHHAGEHGLPCPTLSPQALGRLLHHRWPGNVRELKHVMERTLILGAGHREVSPEDVDLGPAEPSLPRTFKEAKRQVVARFERGYVEGLLRAHGGNITQAARDAGKNRRAFFELIRKHDIDAARFRHGG